ncbi:unnamed protein product [Porites evermanni]|uniref:Xrn1 helical domain-containing protein n=1 Tax=Porites evermanni TaxID=104178 RepID=A0ABN8SYR0_9CNID|nr:unnamed protein product [Porites evermanni]
MCFFVGNDFLPHLPSLEIREGAIDRLVGIYKRVLPRCGGYLAKHGIVDLNRVQMVLQELGYVEDEIFKKRQANDLAYKRRLKENKERERQKRQRMDAPLWTPSGQFSPHVITNTPSPVVSPRQEAYAMRQQAMSYSAGNTTPQDKANKSAAADLRAMLTTPSPNASMLSAASTPNSVPVSNKRKKDDDDDEEPKDDIRKATKVDSTATVSGTVYCSYPLLPFGIVTCTFFPTTFLEIAVYVGLIQSQKRCLGDHLGVHLHVRGAFVLQQADAYVEGLCWVLLYYYQGCPSWKWFYPYHYAPFASDFRDLGSLPNSFERGTQPFKPLEQLMGVFPAASGKFLPPTWRELMSHPDSAIIDFYPLDFEIDLNGKKYAWQGVALLPFVDEKRLLGALSNVYPDLTDLEKKRNSRGKDRLFVRQGNPTFDFFVGLYEGDGIKEAVDVVADLTGGMSGKVQTDDCPILPHKTVPSPVPQLYDLKDNRTISVFFIDPAYDTDHIFKADVLPKADPPARVLKPEGYDSNRPYRPVIGMNANRTSFAHLGDAGRRMLNFHKGDLFRPYTPASYVPPFRSNSCPPQNDSRHGYPDRPRSNPGTPVSSRGNHDPRRQIYDRNRAPQYNSGGYQGNQSYYNSGGYQGNRSQYNSSNYQGNWSQSNAYSRGPGSSQSQYSRGSYQHSSRDPRQQQQYYNRQGPPNRDDRRHSYPLSNYRYRPY